MLDPAALARAGLHRPPAGGSGSANPRPHGRPAPRARARPRRRRVALVGKGITFDSGGISLKPGDKMWEMKGDMAGAAAVLYAMRALGKIRPDVKVVGILCCAENMPDANAQRPGDIFTAKNGKSVMVDNTDAEGRLILIDGLARAGEEGATHVVDIATLTGAVVRALGPSVAGHPGHRPRPRRAASSAPARTTASPSGSCRSSRSTRSRSRPRSPTSTTSRPGGLAGAITAGLFLREFVPERGGLGPPRHRRADVPRQGLEVLRGRRHRLRREDARGPVRALP